MPLKHSNECQKFIIYQNVSNKLSKMLTLFSVLLQVTQQTMFKLNLTYNLPAHFNQELICTAWAFLFSLIYMTTLIF